MASSSHNETSPIEPQPDTVVGSSDPNPIVPDADVAAANVTKKVKTAKEENDYDSVLSAFDDFAAEKANNNHNNYNNYAIGDMVWGKVKSHPWWPGHVYDESFATVSVRRSKREGHVLVAFFGDGSYGWFEPEELIPFDENFDEKSTQTSAKAFVHAVEEAVDELSRRRSVGIVCKCRNPFNFWPSGVEGHVIVDVGDYEPGSYSIRQVEEARESFKPREMVEFIKEVGLRPMEDRFKTVEFMKNKATVLACRKAMYEEFDETYAQAFGTVAVRPPKPTAPVIVGPSKAPLSGRLVIAETLGKGKASAKPTKTKEQLEKDKYLFKRRDVSGSSGKVAQSSQTHRTSEEQSTILCPPILVEGGKKKAKTKRPAGELSSENATPVEKKKKKKVKREISGDLVQAPVLGSSSAKVENVLGEPDSVPPENNIMPVSDVEKPLSSPVETQREVKTEKFELLDVVRDLRSLAVDPSHGKHRGCAAIVRSVFWKYRSLVYKKSRVLSPPAEADASEAGKLPATSATVDRALEKTVVKPVRPLGRPDDPTRGGRKRGQLDNIEGPKKKKKVNNEEVKIKKKQARLDSEEITKKNLKDPENPRPKKKGINSESPKKKKVDNSKISAGDKKNVLPAPPKALKPESGKRVPSPTMLVMKFPVNSSLPTNGALRAKFTRFGPLDHDATRIFWKTFQCRLVYNYKEDAEEALQLCNDSPVLFGNSNVKCYTREIASEAADVEPSKGLKDKAPSQPALKTSAQSQQPHVQLKSCLKKPVGEDSGNGNGRGAPRVKFALGGEESSNRSEPVAEGGSGSYVNIASAPPQTNIAVSYNLSSAAPQTNIATAPPQTNIAATYNLPTSAPQTNIATAPPQTNIAGTYNLPTSAPQTNIATAPPPVQYPPFAGNMPFDYRQGVINPPPFPQMPVAPQNPNDISQQMMDLLIQCNNVVNNVSGALGYMPYHPL